MDQDMTEEQAPFDDLLRSPFDPAPGEARSPLRRISWELVAGIAVGALAVIGGYSVASGDSTTAVTTTTTTTSATTTAGPSTTVVSGDAEVAFPPGFLAVTDMIGIKPEYIIDTGDQLIVSFTTASRRGFEDAVGFYGGDWVLETAAGGELTAAGVTSSPVVAGSFSVQFAKEGEVVPERMYLVSKWEVDSRDGSIEVPFPGTPFESSDIAIDLGGGIVLTLDQLTLGDTSGQVSWSFDGAGDRGGVLSGLFVSVGPASAPAAIYYQSDGGFNPFGGFDAADVATSGTWDLTRQDDAGTNEDTLSIQVSATLIGILPADLAFDLTEVPGLDR
jgi:hypothetical protein